MKNNFTRTYSFGTEGTLNVTDHFEVTMEVGTYVEENSNNFNYYTVGKKNDIITLHIITYKSSLTFKNAPENYISETVEAYKENIQNSSPYKKEIKILENDDFLNLFYNETDRGDLFEKQN